MKLPSGSESHLQQTSKKQRLDPNQRTKLPEPVKEVKPVRQGITKRQRPQETHDKDEKIQRHCRKKLNKDDDSDVDNYAENEPGQSSNTPMLPMREDDESDRTIDYHTIPVPDNSFPPEAEPEEHEDLSVSLGDQHWKLCSGDQKLTANTSSFSFVANAEGKNVDMAKIRTPMPLLSYLSMDTECETTRIAVNGMRK